MERKISLVNAKPVIIISRFALLLMWKTGMNFFGLQTSKCYCDFKIETTEFRPITENIMLTP